jgi:hypothetical protein
MSRRDFGTLRLRPLRHRFARRLRVEVCEERVALSAVQPAYLLGGSEITPFGTINPTGVFPTPIRHAYGFDAITFGSMVGDGTGQTIAIIDAFDNPKFVSSASAAFVTSDLHLFDLAFGIPDPPSFTKVNQTGGTAYPTADTGWGSEIALDVEWAHALAPGANILLVEANSNSLTDLQTATLYARTVPDVTVVTMSFGGSEFSGETGFDSTYITPGGHAGVTFLASTGDSGSPGSYPAYSPNVVAVGGTTLTVSGGNYLSETGWSGSGGGISTQENKPSYQSAVTQSATRRTIPDVAFDANPATGVPVYDSFAQGAAAPWVQIGGTSFSAPAFAALIAVANQGRAAAGEGSLNGRTETLPKLYAMAASNFHDITSGNNGFAAAAGYDLVTGRGSPFASRVVNDLIDDAVPPTAAATFAGVTAAGGTSYQFTVTYADNLNVSVATLDGLDVVVTGPNGFSAPATFVGVNVNSDGSPRVGTYRFTPPGGSWDAADSGSYTVSVQAGQVADTHGNFVAAGGLGSFSMQLAPAPAVASVTINDGSAQRSRVTSLTVTFGSQVTFAGLVADAFRLSRIGGGAVGGFTATAGVVNGVTVVTLSGFSGAETQFGSLADGRYALTVLASQVSAGGLGLDGNGDGLGGDDYVLNGTAANGLFRLYGDATGEGVVNAADFSQFRSALGAASPDPAYLLVSYFDIDGDGSVNAFDFGQFRNRFGVSLFP